MRNCEKHLINCCGKLHFRWCQETVSNVSMTKQLRPENRSASAVLYLNPGLSGGFPSFFVRERRNWSIFFLCVFAPPQQIIACYHLFVVDRNNRCVRGELQQVGRTSSPGSDSPWCANIVSFACDRPWNISNCLQSRPAIQINASF